MEILNQDSGVVLKCLSKGWLWNATRLHAITYSPVARIGDEQPAKNQYECIIREETRTLPPHRPPSPIPRKRQREVVVNFVNTVDSPPPPRPPRLPPVKAQHRIPRRQFKKKQS